MNAALRASNSPEKKLLVLCARTAITAEQTQEIVQLCSGPVDWEYLISESLENSVTPTVHRQLLAVASSSTSPQAAIPIHTQEKLREIGRSLAIRAMFLTAELLRVLDAFRAAGIRAIPYKGPVLAAQAYGDFTLREFEDLDIILAQRDLAAAHEIVLAFGYKPKFEWILSANAKASLVPGEYNYRDIPRNAMIELHTERTLRHFPVVPDIDSFQSKLISVRLAERGVPTFAPEELLTMLCIHGSKDFWERLSWTADVSELVRAYPRLDWDRALRFAESQRATRMVNLGLALAMAVLDLSLPSEVAARVENDKVATDVAGEIAGRLLGRPFVTLSGMGRLQYRRRMVSGFAGGWRYAARLAVVPAEEDWQMVQLPPALAPLYLALRPLRLLKKYGFGRE